MEVLAIRPVDVPPSLQPESPQAESREQIVAEQGEPECPDVRLLLPDRAAKAGRRGALLE